MTLLYQYRETKGRNVERHPKGRLVGKWESLYLQPLQHCSLDLSEIWLWPQGHCSWPCGGKESRPMHPQKLCSLRGRKASKLSRHQLTAFLEPVFSSMSTSSQLWDESG